MNWPLCFVVFLCGGSFSEPFFSAQTAASSSPSSLNSVLSHIQKLKQKTASISKAIEQTAPAGSIGNLASSVIGATSSTTVNVMRTTTNKIDAVAKDSAKWVKNFTSFCADKGAEMMIHKFQQYAVKQNMDNMELPDIETKISGVTITASGGFFSSFASLYKSKSINFTVTDEGIVITIPLSLAVLNTGYRKFQAKLFFVSMSAGLSMEVSTNAINVHLRVKAINPCALNVDRVEVAALEGLTINYKTDCKTCSTIISKITSGFANFMKGTLRKQIQEGIDKGLRKIIKDDSFICAHFVKSII